MIQMREERREYEICCGTWRAHGRSRVFTRCPFCGAEVILYLWSLAGSGKLCKCGAKFNSRDCRKLVAVTVKNLE